MNIKLTTGPIMIKVPKMNAEPVNSRKYRPKIKFSVVTARLNIIVTIVTLIILFRLATPFRHSYFNRYNTNLIFILCSIVYIDETDGLIIKGVHLLKKIGRTIKLIRKQKKLTQKEVYAGIISRNFVSKFENGVNSIEAEKLFAILKRLGMSLNEFQFIHENNEKYKFNTVLNEIDIAAENQNYDKLAEIHAQYKDSLSLDGQVVAATAYIKIYVHGHNPLTMSVDPAYPLQEHLKIDVNWSFFELRSFVDGIFIFRKDSLGLKLCMNKAFDTYVKYQNFIDLKAKAEQSMASIVLNYVQIQLTNFNYNSVDLERTIKKSAYRNMRNFSAKLTGEFTKLLCELYFGNNQERIIFECHDFLQMLKKLESPDYKVFQSIYNYHLPYSQSYRKNHSV